MPHLRLRHASALFDKLIKASTLVGVFGHRQVGKTTFLESHCASYASLDDRETLLESQRDPGSFLRSLGAKPAGLDECQINEDLFPALKEFTRKTKTPGQVILSGSVRFYSRQAIRESLTGRILNIEMLPLCFTELMQLERNRLPLKLHGVVEFHAGYETAMTSRELKRNQGVLETYLTHGGLPGICFLRDERNRAQKLRDQLQLILDRDLRLIRKTSIPFSDIEAYVRMLATLDGDPIRATRLRQQTGISETTQKHLLHALESVFVIRQLAIEGERRGTAVFFEDQAEAAHLAEGRLETHRAFENLVYRNLRASYFYEHGLNFRIFQFRMRPDIRVPFAFATPEGTLGIIPIEGQRPSGLELRSAHRFLQRYSPGNVLMVTRNMPETVVVEPRILQIPAERLLF